jgi:Ribonuclease G/E
MEGRENLQIVVNGSSWQQNPYNHENVLRRQYIFVVVAVECSKQNNIQKLQTYMSTNKRYKILTVLM